MSRIICFYDNAAGPHLLLDAANDRVIGKRQNLESVVVERGLVGYPSPFIKVR